MMKYLLTIAAILASLCGSAQIFQKTATNNAWNRVKSDSAMYLPLDTFRVSTATQAGQPVGDSGRIAYKDGRFWGKNNTKWLSFNTGDNFVSWSSKLLLLQSEISEPIQPSDSLPSALGKLQAQINDGYGRFIEIKDTAFGPLVIQNPLNTPTISLIRADKGLAGDTTQAIVTFYRKDKTQIGWLGIGRNVPADTNGLDWINFISNNTITSRDTASTAFAIWNGSDFKYYTFFHGGKWKMLKDPALDVFHRGIFNNTLEVQGKTQLDTLSVSGKIMSMGPINSGQEITSGDGNIANYMTYSASAGVLGTFSNHPLEFWVNSARRATILQNGFMGLAEYSPTERLHVNGNVKVIGTIEVGGVKWISGSGSPEGSVSAPAGSLYSNTSGGAGTTFFVKESGSGNTGWIAK